MIFIRRIDKWSSTHHPWWLVFLRVILGGCLFVKGMSFLQDAQYLENLIAGTRFNSNNNILLAQIITWVHLLGGTFIVIGFFTRLSVLLQIPILLGAIIFVNAKMGFSPGSELGFALLILLLLIVFFIEGGGPLSLDNYFKNYFKINEEH
jgi:putative oxidoreductase